MCLPIETETLFLETISIKNAKAMLLPWHLRRMQETQREIFGRAYLSELSLHEVNPQMAKRPKIIWFFIMVSFRIMFVRQHLIKRFN